MSNKLKNIELRLKNIQILLLCLYYLSHLPVVSDTKHIRLMDLYTMQSMPGVTAPQAALFTGTVTVLGFLTKSGGTFKIDHPQDPENKYLFHSFVESPDMML